jgi:hypothetical protein
MSDKDKPQKQSYHFCGHKNLAWKITLQHQRKAKTARHMSKICQKMCWLKNSMADASTILSCN